MSRDEDDKLSQAEAAKRQLRKGIERSRALVVQYRTSLLLLKTIERRSSNILLPR